MKRKTIALLSGLGLLLGAVGAQAGSDNPRPVVAKPGLTSATTVAKPATGFRSHGRTVTVDLQPAKPASGGTIETTAVGNRISGAAMAGSVRGFATTPDGATAVYLADQDTLDLVELYSVPVDGGAAPVKLNGGLTFGTGDQGVSLFQISPDGSRVIFLADPVQGGGIDELYSAPVDGSVAAVKLNGTGDVPVTAFGITPDYNRVAYFGTSSSGVVELYRASIDTAGTATRLSNIAGFNSQGNAVAAEISPDSARVVFAADRSADDVFQWFSVALSATGPGTEVRLSNALNFVSLGAISPDSSTVVYTGDDGNNLVMDLYSVPIAGGTRTRLNPVHGGNGVSEIAISSDNSRVAYLADQNTLDLNELYSARIAVAASGTRLNTPLSGSQSVDTMTITPDGATVLYEADENLAGTFDLLAVPIDGSAGPVTLHGMTPPDNAGSFGDEGTPVFGRRVVYPVFGANIDFYNVPLGGSEPFTRINDPMTAGEDLFNAYLPAASGRLLAYGVGPTADGITSRVYAASVRADLTAEQFNSTATSGSLGVLAYEIGADEAYAVYVQDQATVGKPELFSAALDSDADGVTNGADDCRFVGNPLQNGAVFAPAVLADSTTEFGWGVDADLRWVRGPLASVDVLATDASGSVNDARSLIDATQPSAGAGFYYLFAPDCPGRSYQSSVGVEPQRDLAAFP